VLDLGKNMDDTVLKLFPDNPAYVPDQVSRAKAKEYMVTLFPEATEVVEKVSGKIEFIDAGTNLETITCPNCLMKINMGWWQLAMKQANETHFRNLAINTPCCGAILSLNDLQYHWPVGFARYSLEVINPGWDMDGDEVKILESTLGSELRKIWAHY